MELFWVLAIWISSMYLIRLYRELSIYRKYMNQHNDIYVPSYNEIIDANHFRLKFPKLLHTQFKKVSSVRPKNAASVLSKHLVSESVYPNSLYSKE